MNQEFVLRWAKRLLVYLAGLFCMALGVVFSVKSALGVSPVTCLANVVYQITLTLPGGGIDLGICTTAVYCLYILAELLILRRQFKPVMLLQIVASFLFGGLVSVATSVMAFLPAPEGYPMRLVFLLISIPLVALGVMLYLAPNILPTPGEGMSLAISKKTGLSVANCKMIFDCTMVVVSAIVSLAYFHGLVGVREGTVLSALLVGFVMKRMMRVCQAPLLRFVERETKVERAANAAQPVALDRSGKPKIMVTLGREFGSGGHEIAQKLAQELGVNVYYLSHFFREQFGLSFQEYVGKLRCEKARRELLLTNRSLLDISLACGFSSPKYFQRAFARQYGATPREYRRMAPRESEARQTPGVLTSQEFLSNEQSLSIVQRLLEQLP